MRRGITAGAAAAALSFWLAACSTPGAPGRSTAIGEAFAGPSELALRADIPLESRVVAKVRHGERLEILEQKRGAFYRVRTPQGAEGWTDSHELLTPEEMASLRDLAQRAQGMPSQGVATTYAELRVHTSPSRTAPSFIVLKENDKVDVLGYLTSPRASAPRKPLLPPTPIKPKKAASKASKAPKYPPPPPPKPPGPPPNWIELSQPTLSDSTAERTAPVPEPEEPESVPTETWSLVRTTHGECGWALARSLYMAIPDEVAQYAERHRIVSYFSLGETQDGDQARKDWLWTTSSGAEPSYDFDSFRVFVWSLRRHRYETAHIESGLKGYLPVRLSEIQAPVGPKGKRQSATYSGFSVCVEKADGQRRRREYAFMNPAVRLVREEPCEPPPPLLSTKTPAPAPAVSAAPAKKETLAERGKRWLHSITPKWLSK